MITKTKASLLTCLACLPIVLLLAGCGGPTNSEISDALTRQANELRKSMPTALSMFPKARYQNSFLLQPYLMPVDISITKRESGENSNGDKIYVAYFIATFRLTQPTVQLLRDHVMDKDKNHEVQIVRVVKTDGAIIKASGKAVKQKESGNEGIMKYVTRVDMNTAQLEGYGVPIDYYNDDKQTMLFEGTQAEKDFSARFDKWVAETIADNKKQNEERVAKGRELAATFRESLPGTWVLTSTDRWKYETTFNKDGTYKTRNVENYNDSETGKWAIDVNPTGNWVFLIMSNSANIEAKLSYGYGEVLINKEDNKGLRFYQIKDVAQNTFGLFSLDFGSWQAARK